MSPNGITPASIATPIVTPISMVSRPKSSSIRSSSAITSRSEIPQLPPCDQTVSYSGCFVTYLPGGVVEDAEHWMMQPRWQACGEAAALRLELRLGLPLIFDAPSNWPCLKLKVG